jgi:uncharacterized membrane protein YbhN (UPF0104 family)
MRLNNEISNPIAGTAWLVAGGVLVVWFRGKVREYRERRRELKAEGRSTELDGSGTLIAAGVGGVALWMALYLLLDTLF